MPPPPKDPPKKEDSWDDALGDRAQQTVSPEMVRKLLEMNPALREAGMNTNVTVDQVQRAHQKAATVPPVVEKKPQADAVATFADFKKRLRKIDDDIAALKKARDEAVAQTRERVAQWLLQNDPDIKSPVTQALLEKEKSFLDGIGFSVKAFVEKRMKR